MTKMSQLLVILLCTQLLLPIRLCAQTVPDGTAGASSPAPTTDLNLRSATRNISASQLGNLTSAEIRVGSNVRTVTTQDMLTPAELVAVQQVLATGTQSINLSNRGRATGGTFSVTPELSAIMASLVVPRGVTALYDAGAAHAFNLTGDLTNSGTLYALSSNPAVTNATIGAANIINSERALISTILPTTAGVTSAVDNLNLTLSALQNIVNAGAITSSGNLTAVAGGSIINALPAGSTAPTAVMQAAGNLNLQAANFVNSGLLAASAGNINLASHFVSDVVVNNVGGRLEALSGVVNVRDALFSGKANVLLTGGDILSNELNVYSGAGVIDIHVNDLKGVVNLYGHEAHIGAATENLNLGTIELGGDPLLFNTSGNVTISSLPATNGQNLTVVASGNILVSTFGLQINTSSSTGNGGHVLMVAGANVVNTGPTLEITTSTDPGGGSSTGGRIDLANIGLFQTRSEIATGQGSGGDVTLIAYAGSGAQSGTIQFPTASVVPIATGGRGGGTNGSVTVIAGASTGQANSIFLSNVNTSPQQGGQGANGTGNVAIHTATPNITNGPVIVDTANGNVSGGTFAPGTPQSASIRTGNVQTPGSDITIVAGANALMGSVTSIGLPGSTGSNGGSINVTVNRVTDTTVPFIIGGTTGCTNCTTGGFSATATTSGQNGNAGSISVANAGSAGIRVANTAFLTVPILAANGNGGTIRLDAAAGNVHGPLQLVAGTYTANGANFGSGNGGQIILIGSSLTNFNGGAGWTFTAAGKGTGSGGTVSVTSTSGATDLAFGTGAGQISSIDVQGGLSGGNGGSVSLSSGRNLSLNTASVLARPLATNGNGANYTLAAGTAGAGNLQVAGTINANASGSGNGGSVTLSYNDATNPFVVGSAVTSSGVTGNIDANAPGTGLAGSISISNHALAALSVNIPGTISASSAAGSLGAISFNHPGQLVDVNSSGGLVGAVSATGSSISLNSQATSALVLQSVSSTGGSVSVGASSVVVLAGGSVQAAGGNAVINTALLTNDGSVASDSQVLIQGVSGLTVSGAGSLSGTGGVNLEGGSGALSVSAGALNGTVSANGASVNVTAQSGNLDVVGASASSGAVALAAASGNLTLSGNVSAGGGTLSLSSGGATNAVLDSFNGTVSANGSSVDISTMAGDLQVDAVSSSLGGVVLSAGGGNLVINGDVSAPGGNITLTSAAGSSNSVTVTASGSLQATGTGVAVTINTANLDNQGTISSEGATTIAASNLDNQGSISSGGATTIAASNLSNQGSISSAEATTITASNLDNQGSISSGGATTIVASNLVNDGTISSAGVLAVESDGNLSVTGSGSLLGGTISLVSTGGSVSASSGALSGTVTGSATGSFALTVTAGGLTAGDITAANGSLNLVAGGGALNVEASATLSATEGDLILQNTDSLNGTISIGQGATLSAFSAGTTLGRINIVIGDVPQTPVAGSTPTNVLVTLANGGRIFFGTNGASALPPDNLFTVDGSVVIVDTGSRPDSAITFGGGVNLTATAYNPIQVTVLDSLDLTSAPVISLILTLQSNGAVGGSLLVVGGMVVGGNLIVDPTDLAPALTAVNVPENVTLTFEGFQATNVVDISLSETSTTPHVVFAGTQQFVSGGGGSVGVISIASTQGGPVLVMPQSGLLSSDGSLTVNAVGDVSLGGNVTADQVHVTASGSLTIGDTISTNGSISAVAGSGTLTVLPLSVLFANEGNILLHNTDAANGMIFIGEASFIKAFTWSEPELGNVSVVVGTIAKNPPEGPKPNNTLVVRAFGGRTFFGAKSIDAHGPLNVLMALGRDIVFDTNGRPANTITLGGLVTIIADPPPPAAIPVMRPSLSSTALSASIPSVGSHGNVPTYWLPALIFPNYTLPVGTFANKPVSAAPDWKPSVEATRAVAREVDSSDILTPIAYSYPSSPSPKAVFGVTSLDTQSAIVRSADDINIVQTSQNSLMLHEGEALISAKTTTTIRIGDCTITVAPGADILVERTPTLVVVRNLHERKLQSVHIAISNTHSTHLAAGHEIMIGSDTSILTDQRKHDAIGRRALKDAGVTGGISITTCEVSLVTLVSRNKLLSAIARSEMMDNRAIRDRIVKMAACLHIATPERGAYSSTPHSH